MAAIEWVDPPSHLSAESDTGPDDAVLVGHDRPPPPWLARASQWHRRVSRIGGLGLAPAVLLALLTFGPTAGRTAVDGLDASTQTPALNRPVPGCRIWPTPEWAYQPGLLADYVHPADAAFDAVRPTHRTDRNFGIYRCPTTVPAPEPSATVTHSR